MELICQFSIQMNRIAWSESLVFKGLRLKSLPFSIVSLLWASEIPQTLQTYLFLSLSSSVQQKYCIHSQKVVFLFDPMSLRLDSRLTNDKERKGSYVLEPCLQVAHTTLDLNFPPKSLKMTDLSSYLFTQGSVPNDALMMLWSSIIMYSWASSCLPVSYVFQTLFIAATIDSGFREIYPSCVYCFMKTSISQNAQLWGWAHFFSCSYERQ